MPVAEPVIVDAHTLEVSVVPPNVAALRFQARLDILQFYHFLWEQWQSHVRPQFVHHVTSILLTELLNYEVLTQRSAKRECWLLPFETQGQKRTRERVHV